MDCHNCEHLGYSGCPYGRCMHPGHQDVRFSRADAKKRREEGNRAYNRQICPDFSLKKRCSNCANWTRGHYFSDGMTPAAKGCCTLGREANGGSCPKWKPGKTSWRRRELTFTKGDQN